MPDDEQKAEDLELLDDAQEAPEKPQEVPEDQEAPKDQEAPEPDDFEELAEEQLAKERADEFEASIVAGETLIPLAPNEPETTGPQSNMSLQARFANWEAGGREGPRPERAAPGYEERGKGYTQPTPPEPPQEEGTGEATYEFEFADQAEDRQPRPPANPERQPDDAPSEMGGDDGLANAVAEGNKSMAELLVTADLLVGMIPEIKAILEEIREAIKEINTGVT